MIGENGNEEAIEALPRGFSGNSALEHELSYLRRYPAPAWDPLWRLRRGAPQPDQHRDRKRHQQQRDELRRGNAEDDAARIATIELDDVPRHPVQNHVKPERPPGKRPAAA